MFKELLNLPAMLKQASVLTDRMKELTDQLRGQRFSGASGGGLVEAEANGVGEILQVKIDRRLIERQEGEMIEDLLPAAINQALEKGRQANLQAMQQLGEGLNVPGLQAALTRMMGGGP